MTESTIRHVIFDMDGVLCHTDFLRGREILGKQIGVTPAAIEANIYRAGFDHESDQGRFTAEQYLQGMSERLGVAVGRADWLAARKAAMTPDTGMLALARALGQRVKIAMLTNNGPVLRAHIGEVFPEVVEVFGARAFFSCEFGTGKEAPEVFALLLERIGAVPAETLFIDDSANFIENGRAAGLNVHHFRGIDRLRAQLVTLGLG
jgi:putative hydrolase of the HAD superfamily